jgi:hypothetical protein
VTVHSVDLNHLELYEAGAFLVSLLAYPGESKEDDERREAAYHSLCAWVLRVRAEIDPDWATRPQLIKPVYTSQTESDCNRGFRTLRRRLHERMVQGTQYTSLAFGGRCRETDVRPSMGSVGDAYDNAMCESFFATLECELLARRRFTS